MSEIGSLIITGLITLIIGLAILSMLKSFWMWIFGIKDVIKELVIIKEILKVKLTNEEIDQVKKRLK